MQDIFMHPVARETTRTEPGRMLHICLATANIKADLSSAMYQFCIA